MIDWVNPYEHDERYQALLKKFEAGWGATLDIPTEWYELIFELDTKITALVPDYKLLQVKEKFGGLRYYVEYGEDASEESKKLANQWIDAAEAAAYKIGF